MTIVNGTGVFLNLVNQSRVYNNTLNSYHGIVLRYSNNNIIIGNILHGYGAIDGYGVEASFSSNNSIIDADISSPCISVKNTNMTLINVTCKDYTYDIMLSNYGVNVSSSVLKKWYLNMRVADSSNNAISGVTIEILDSQGSLVFNETTDTDGLIMINLTEYLVLHTRTCGPRCTYTVYTPPRGWGAPIIHYSPYNITIKKTGYEPITYSITLDSNKEFNSTMVLDTTPPYIGFTPEKIPDYAQFSIKANVTDAWLENVVFLLNSTPINYSISGDVYTSRCIGPFVRGTALNFTIIAGDRAGNIAAKEFNIPIVDGEIKLEGEGKVKEENRSVRIELEAKWKKGKVGSEIQLNEKDKEEKEKFKAHGKIDKLYKDCSGVFRISGVAKVEVKEDKEKFKEKNVSFTGSITESEIKIIINGREFAVPAKVHIKM